MKILITSLLLLASLIAAAPAKADAMTASPANGNEINNDFSFIHYSADYAVNADASSTTTESYEILLKTKVAVDNFSQVRLAYSEKMETLEVLSAYTLAVDGQRHNVEPERIYTQESYSNVAAPIYADYKVRVIVFPNLTPGTRLVYQLRRTRHTPHFPGYFGLWNTFSIFHQYENAEINLTAPADLPIHIFSRDLQGSDTPKISNGQAHWRWHYQRHNPLKVQNWTAPAWTFSPTIMASTYQKWSKVAEAYQVKAKTAAQLTPEISALAEKITAGTDDRRAQAAALYHWVAQNIRYVAVYLGNGGLEPNTAQSVLDHHYGDCKDHAALLEALLAAKGIDSSPVLIGAGSGPILPNIPLLEGFNHVITYLPEFDLYVDSTTPWARFGQLPVQDLSAPVLHTKQAQLARTPNHDQLRNYNAVTADFIFDESGNMRGHTEQQWSEVDEIDQRAFFSQVNVQNQAATEASMMASSGIDGSGHFATRGDPFDFTRPFSSSYTFAAEDFVDFGIVGGIVIPNPPGSWSFRNLALSSAAPANATPFACDARLRDEIYQLEFPASVPIIAVPANQRFHNAAGEYQVEWQRQGQRVSVHHRLQLNAIHGKDALCQPQDYPEFRALYQQVRRGFRGQIVYGQLPSHKNGS